MEVNRLIMHRCCTHPALLLVMMSWSFLMPLGPAAMPRIPLNVAGLQGNMAYTNKVA
jgi:hypothetical protein